MRSLLPLALFVALGLGAGVARADDETALCAALHVAHVEGDRALWRSTLVRCSGARTTVTTEEVLGAKGDDVLLKPPLAPGDAVQRIEVTGPDELRFEPSLKSGLVHEVGLWRSPRVSGEARRAADEALGGKPTALDAMPVYVVAGPDVAQGVRGRLLTAEERAMPGRLLALTVFMLLASALGLAYRLLGSRAKIEQAEAALREEFERGR